MTTPTKVATPFPPLKEKIIGLIWPKTTKKAHKAIT